MKHLAGLVLLATLAAGGYYLLSRKNGLLPRVDLPLLGDIKEKLPSSPISKLPPVDLIAAPIIGPGPALFWWVWRKRKKRK